MQDDQISDTILVERFQNGSRDAMDVLVKRHQSKAYRMALRLTNDQDQAADVVAEAFIRMFRSTHSFKGHSSFTTWMYRIVTNCFLDIRKKAVRRPTVSLELTLLKKDCASERFFESGDTNPHYLLETRERDRSIGEKVADLPHLQKVMITLYHQEMLSYEQIAETLDLPIGTVKSRLNRARLKLRTALDSERSLFVQQVQVAA